MSRTNQIILIGTFIGFSWLAMQAVHELGHVIGAITTGGKVTTVVLHPLTISRTDVYPNPHPLIEVWAGAAIGSTIPLLFFLLARMLALPGIYLFRFFAGFCLVTNGVYIGAGWLAEEGADSYVMIQHGSPVWTLVLFGVITVPAGLYLWHRQGRHFGLSGADGKVDGTATLISVCLLAGLALAEALLSSR